MTTMLEFVSAVLRPNRIASVLRSHPRQTGGHVRMVAGILWQS